MKETRKKIHFITFELYFRLTSTNENALATSCASVANKEFRQSSGYISRLSLSNPPLRVFYARFVLQFGRFGSIRRGDMPSLCSPWWSWWLFEGAEFQLAGPKNRDCVLPLSVNFEFSTDLCAILCMYFLPTDTLQYRLDRTTTTQPHGTFCQKILFIRSVLRRHFGRRRCRYSSADANADNDQTTFVFFRTSSSPFVAPKCCVRSEYNTSRPFATSRRKKGSVNRRFVAIIGPSMLLMVPIWVTRCIQ
jgi:hypothetical protein